MDTDSSPVETKPENTPKSPSKRSKRLPLLLVGSYLLGATSVATWAYRDQIWNTLKSAQQSIASATYEEVKALPQPDPILYGQLHKELKATRLDLSSRYRACRTSAEKKRVLLEAQTTLESTLPKMMRCWLGTEWDFNGTATVPGEGKIACGYYVSTIMRDAGFKVQRVKLAQQPSQNIIRTFVPRSELSISAGKNYDTFLSEITEHGIYIVGLDRHVAFLVHDDSGFHFIHSAGGNTKLVVDENRDNASYLMWSNYRVISNISRHQPAIKKWLLEKDFPTHT